MNASAAEHRSRITGIQIDIMEEVKKIALLLADERNSYQQLLVEKAVESAARHKVEVLPPQFAEGKSIKQIGQFFDCVSSTTPPDGIVSMLVSAEAMKGSVEAVAKDGIDCVLVNRIPDFLPQLRSAFPDVLLASVAPDQVEIGRLQGHQCLKLLPDGGKVVLVLGDQGSPSTDERRRGLLEVVGNIVTVKELQGRWRMERAEEVVNHFFRISGERTEVDLFVSQNDPMAAGVRSALDNQAKQLGRAEIAEIPVIGCDGLPNEGLKMVRERKLAATVIMPPTSPQAVEILSSFWTQGVRTQSSTPPPSSFPAIDALGPR